MADIDVPTLVADIEFWLPSSNTINSTGLTKLANIVLNNIGSVDESVYDEALCKCLRIAARKNKVDTSANMAGRKKIKVDGIEEQFYESTKAIKAWDNYIEELPSICSFFGYTEETPSTQTLNGSILISVEDKFDIEDEFISYPTSYSTTTSDLYL